MHSCSSKENGRSARRRCSTRRLLDLDGVRLGRARCTVAENNLAYVPLLSALRDVIGDDERLTQIVVDEDAPRLGTLEAFAFRPVREHAPLALGAGRGRQRRR